MINLIFDKYKFKRTYIGGSKKNELAKLMEVQDTNNDFKNPNIIEYRKLLTIYFNDLLNVLLSWKILMLNISFFLLFFSLLFLNYTILFFLIICLSILSLQIHIIFAWFLNKKIKLFDMCLNILSII